MCQKSHEQTRFDVKRHAYKCCILARFQPPTFQLSGVTMETGAFAARIE